MPVSLVLDPPDFVLPPKPLLVVVRVDRDAFPHFDPDMDPLTDEDSFTRILRKGKKALDNIRREVSIKLWGADLPCAEGTRMGWPQPGGGVTVDSPPLRCHRYLGFFFIHNIPAGEFKPAVVELTSDPTPVDDCIQFHAIEPNENGKAGHREHYKDHCDNQKGELPPGGEGSLAAI